MKFTFTGQYQYNPPQLLRKCGYHPFTDPNTRELSFSRQLNAGQRYPRFHCYVVHEKSEEFTVDLHLDQKQPSYAGTNKHAGEYEGENIRLEMVRIYTILQSLKR